MQIFRLHFRFKWTIYYNPPFTSRKIIEFNNIVSPQGKMLYSRICQFYRVSRLSLSCIRSPQYGLLYTKRFEREKFLALVRNNEDYSARMDISSHLQENFKWWSDIFSNPLQSNKIRSGRFVREIFTDASLNGWGASCRDERTRGWWSKCEKLTLHINSLELKAAFNDLRCFAADLHDCNVLLRIDNTTALAYINKFGSIRFPHLSEISRQI